MVGASWAALFVVVAATAGEPQGEAAVGGSSNGIPTEPSTSTTTTTSTSTDADASPTVPPPEPAPAGAFLADSAPIVLARRPWGDGGAVERILESSGDIVLHTVNAAGTVQSCTKVGSLFALRILEQRDAAGGEVVHVVEDESGARLRYVVATDGEARAVELVAPSPVAAR